MLDFLCLPLSPNGRFHGQGEGLVRHTRSVFGFAMIFERVCLDRFRGQAEGFETYSLENGPKSINLKRRFFDRGVVFFDF